MDDRLDKLQAVELPFGKTIYQSINGQGISTEIAELVDIILEYETKSTKRLLELGSGCGIISIMLKHNRPSWQVTGIDIQNQLVELSLKNSNRCNLQIDFLHNDLRDFANSLPYDLIICNPPYFKTTEGRISPIKERAIARHEVMCTLEDVVLAIQRNLSDSGNAYLLYPQNREEELKDKTSSLDMELDRIAEVSLIKKTEVIIYRIKKK